MIFIFFSSVCFFLEERIWSWLRNRKSSRGSEGMLLWKIFENLDAANGFFRAFWLIFRHILFKFLTLILSASPNYYPKRARTNAAHWSLSHDKRINMQLKTKKYDAFVCTFSIMRAGVELIAIKQVQNYRKLYAWKTFLKMAGGRMHTPHPTP